MSRVASLTTTILVPSVAFGEFVGVIEGTEDTISLPGAKLDRTLYEQRRVQHVDYAHFEAYCRIKSERKERDAADRYISDFRSHSSRLIMNVQSTHYDTRLKGKGLTRAQD